MQQTPAFCDALALLRIWANQRGFCDGFKEEQYCVLGFEGLGYFWGALLAFLLIGEDQSSIGSGKGHGRVLGKSLSSYQLFRAALDFLGEIPSNYHP